MLDRFFRGILPSEGAYALVTIKNKRVVHNWYYNINEFIAAAGKNYDADTYFAVSTFSATKRQQKHHHKAKAIWLDLDLKGTKYASLKEMLNHASEFCKSYRLPRPTIVYTGGGFHLYWSFDADISYDDWHLLATGLHNCATAFGLEFDGKCTRDCARILRVPGSLNHKYDPMPTVQVVGEVAPVYSLARFEQLKHSGSTASPKQNGRVEQKASVASTFLNNTPDGDADFIAEHCPQIKHFKETGSDSEPHWYACANVLKHCHNGLERFLEWSSKYEGYNEDEAKAKFAHAISSNTGPTLCSSFASCRREGCSTCLQSRDVTTPLNAKAKGVKPTHTPEAGSIPSESSAEVQAEDEELTPVLQPFELQDGELWGMSESTTSKSKRGMDIKIVGCDIRFICKLNTSGSGQHLLFKAKDKLQKEYRDIVVPSDRAWGTSCLSEFAKQGVYIDDLSLWRKYVSHHMSYVDSQKIPDTAYDTFGWQDDGSFICGPWKYTDKGRVPIIIASDVKDKASTIGTAPGGNIHDAVLTVARVMSQMSSNQILLYCMSMGAPLVRFVDMEEGGVIGWDYSHESGTGKSTTILLTETSIGQPGCVRMGERDTINAKAAFMALMKSLPITVDDPNIGDGKNINDIVDAAVAGADKNALNQDRSLRANPKRWRTVLVGASNFNPFDYVGTQRKRRIIGFHEPVKPYLDRSNWGELYASMKRNAGWIMHALLKLYVQPKAQDYIKKRIEQYIQAISAKYKFRVEDRFNVAGIAVALTALECLQKVAKDAGCPLSIDIKQMVEVGVAAAKESMSQADENDGGSASTLLQDFLAEHVGRTITIHKSTARGMTPKIDIPPNMKELAVIIDHGHSRINIRSKTFNNWLRDNGRSPSEVARVLVSERICLRKNYPVQMTVNALGAPPVGMQRCYVMKLEVPEEPEASEA